MEWVLGENTRDREGLAGRLLAETGDRKAILPLGRFGSRMWVRKTGLSRSVIRRSGKKERKGRGLIGDPRKGLKRGRPSKNTCGGRDPNPWRNGSSRTDCQKRFFLFRFSRGDFLGGGVKKSGKLCREVDGDRDTD